MRDNSEIMSQLNRDGIIAVMDFMQNVLKVCSESDFSNLISGIASYFGYEYVLYGYIRSSFCKNAEAVIINVSNPEKWAEEYAEMGYYDIDPVVIELELKVSEKHENTFILWDAYDRELSEEEKKVIARRKSYGLEYGFSSYENSWKKDFAFLVSFGRKSKPVEPYMKPVMDIIISHMSSARKKLDMLRLYELLSERERDVALYLSKGMTNLEISASLDVQESTVKYHLSNIFRKLGASNRQEAISILLAVKYLCISK